MRAVVEDEAVPKRILPTADEPVVVTNGAMPMDTVEIVGTRIRHHGTRTATPSRPSTTADSRFIVEVGRGIDDDAREVFGEQSGTSRHVCERA